MLIRMAAAAACGMLLAHAAAAQELRVPPSFKLGTARIVLGTSASFTSANLAAAVTDETGTGALVFGTSPTIASPAFSGTSTGTYTLGGTPTLSGGTLSGTTTLPGSGQISAAGDLGVGAAPTAARFQIGGTYTTANGQFVNLGGSLASSITSTQYGIQMNTSFNPSGASLTNIFGGRVAVLLSGAGINVSNVYGLGAQLNLNGYTNTITFGSAFNVLDVIPGTNAIGTFSGYNVSAITNGNGITSGSVTNAGVRANTFTAAAGVGGAVTNAGAWLSLGSGSSAGTTNYGLRIDGNGGAASVNYAIYNASTAPNYWVGKMLAAGTAPTLSSCGTSPAIVGDAKAGEVTMGTGSPTGCTITFATAYGSAPYCVVTWQATPLASQSYTVSASAITLTQTATSSNKVNYVCWGRSTG